MAKVKWNLCRLPLGTKRDAVSEEEVLFRCGGRMDEDKKQTGGRLSSHREPNATHISVLEMNLEPTPPQGLQHL